MCPPPAPHSALPPPLQQPTSLPSSLPSSDLALLTLPYDTPPSLPKISGFGASDLTALGIPSEQSLIERYVTATGLDEVAEHMDYHRAFVCFRMAAILQGVYKRSLQGNAAAADGQAIGALAPVLAGVGRRCAQRYEERPARLCKEGAVGAAHATRRGKGGGRRGHPHSHLGPRHARESSSLAARSPLSPSSLSSSSPPSPSLTTFERPACPLVGSVSPLYFSTSHRRQYSTDALVGREKVGEEGADALRARVRQFVNEKILPLEGRLMERSMADGPSR